jgi:uroporphyrin-III C-methyltransferase
MRGFVWFVGAGPGDPDLITLRGHRALQRADVVLYDSLVDPRLIEDLDAELVFVGKRCGRHAMSQQRIIDRIVELALEGNRVVRLKGGDPGVLGRVAEEALPLAERGIPFDIVPGVTSATAVPALAGIPVTHRGVADSFVVATAHRRADDEGLSIPAYHPRTTLVLLMARATVDRWRNALADRGYPPELPVALVSAGCTPRERVLVTNVAAASRDLAEADLATPVLAVVGAVVGLRGRLLGAEAREPRALERVAPAGALAVPREEAHSLMA